MSKALQSVLYVCPSRNDGAQDHQAKREERHASDRTTKPEHFSVGNEYDGQILEYRVDWDRQKL